MIMHLYNLYELMKHNHLQSQSRISHQWFTRKTILYTQHLYFMAGLEKNHDLRFFILCILGFLSEVYLNRGYMILDW